MLLRLVMLLLLLLIPFLRLAILGAAVDEGAHVDNGDVEDNDDWQVADVTRDQKEEKPSSLLYNGVAQIRNDFTIFYLGKIGIFYKPNWPSTKVSIT